MFIFYTVIFFTLFAVTPANGFTNRQSSGVLARFVRTRLDQTSECLSLTSLLLSWWLRNLCHIKHTPVSKPSPSALSPSSTSRCCYNMLHFLPPFISFVNYTNQQIYQTRAPHTSPDWSFPPVAPRLHDTHPTCFSALKSYSFVRSIQLWPALLFLFFGQ